MLLFLPLVLVPKVHADGCRDEMVVGDVDPALLVFSGSDRDMPVRCSYLISNDGRYSVPIDKADAVRQFESGLPRWMVAALIRSGGDDECVVRVNDADYVSMTLDAVVKRWASESGVSHVMNIIGPDAPDIESAKIEFLDDVCRDLKAEKQRTHGSDQ